MITTLSIKEILNVSGGVCDFKIGGESGSNRWYKLESCARNSWNIRLSTRSKANADLYCGGNYAAHLRPGMTMNCEIGETMFL